MALVEALGVPVVAVLAGTDGAGLWSSPSETATLSVESRTASGWWSGSWWSGGGSWLDGGGHGGWGWGNSWLWGHDWTRAGAAGEDSWAWSGVWLQAVVWLSVWAVDGNEDSWISGGVTSWEGDTLASNGGGSTGDDADLSAREVELGLSDGRGLVVS